MPQIGPMEILVVGILALMVFGPEKLPDMARSVGRFLNQVKAMASEAKSEFDMSIDDRDKNKNEPGGQEATTPEPHEASAVPHEETSEAAATAAPSGKSDSSGALETSSAQQVLVSKS